MGGQVVLGEGLVAQVHVVVEAVVGGGAVGKVRLGVQALDGLRHDMGGAVADDVGYLVGRALVDVPVVVQNLHGSSLPIGMGGDKRDVVRQGLRYVSQRAVTSDLWRLSLAGHEP